MIEQQIGTKPYFKPIPRDDEFESLDKKSWRWRRAQQRKQCCLCQNTAIQWLVFELEGCKKVERYVKLAPLSWKLQLSCNQSQPISGIFSGGSGLKLKLTLAFCASTRSLVAS